MASAEHSKSSRLDSGKGPTRVAMNDATPEGYCVREVDGAGAKRERWSRRLAAAFLFPYTWDLWANGNVRLVLPNARLANLLAVFVRAKLSM